jgi:hypothetical protein
VPSNSSVAGSGVAVGMKSKWAVRVELVGLLRTKSKVAMPIPDRSKLNGAEPSRGVTNTEPLKLNGRRAC